MAITVAQVAINSASFSSSSVASVAKTLTVSAGSTLCAFVTYGSVGFSGLVSVTDSQSGIWQDGSFGASSADLQAVSKFYRTNASSGSITVTASFSSNQQFSALWVVE